LKKKGAGKKSGKEDKDFEWFPGSGIGLKAEKKQRAIK